MSQHVLPGVKHPFAFLGVQLVDEVRRVVVVAVLIPARTVVNSTMNVFTITISGKNVMKLFEKRAVSTLCLILSIMTKTSAMVCCFWTSCFILIVSSPCISLSFTSCFCFRFLLLSRRPRGKALIKLRAELATSLL